MWGKWLLERSDINPLDFIAEGYRLKFFYEQSLTDLLIRFVRMSDKKDQQQTINEIRKVLLNLGPKGFY